MIIYCNRNTKEQGKYCDLSLVIFIIIVIIIITIIIIIIIIIVVIIMIFLYYHYHYYNHYYYYYYYYDRYCHTMVFFLSNYIIYWSCFFIHLFIFLNIYLFLWFVVCLENESELYLKKRNMLH